MPTRFAVKTGNWSDVTTWDNGAVPLPGDTVHPNGFTVTIDTDINVDGLNNNVSPVYLPNMPIPKMTSNTQPTGTVISSNNSGTAWYAFNQDLILTNYWQSAAVSVGWLGYTFSTAKTIKRYFFRWANSPSIPKTWTFEGSNDGFATAGIVLDTVASYTTVANYTSVLLANTTAYTSYRINVTATQGNAVVQIPELEMTESTTASPVYGTITGGSFTVPASLSGTRNIVQTGEGIKSNNSASVITTAHTSGNTVNFNVQSGGYIFNTLNDNASNEIKVCSINGTGAVNFNGDIYGSQNTGNIYNSLGGTIYIGANATVTINGNVYLAKGQSSIFYYTIHLASGVSNSAVLNINGNVIGSSLYQYSAIYLNSLATINIVGNLTSDISPCIITPVTNVFTGGGGFINLTGTANLTNNNSQPCILTRNTLITINGAVINKNNKMAIWGAFIRMTANTSPYWTFQNSAAADITLSYGNPVTGPYPAEADVRYNTAYGASPTRYGTLRVPLPQYVSQGVLTDNTTGTAYLSATDVWNVLTSTITTPGSVGKLVSDNLNATVSSRATQTSVDTANTNVNSINSKVDVTLSTRASQTSVDTANTNINNLPANTTTEVWNKATTGIITAGSIGERLKNASTVQTNGDQLAAYIV